MNCGEVAAHLSYKTLTEFEAEGTNTVNGHSLQLPNLSAAEKTSPIGASMGYLMGLFFSLKQQLLAERASKNITSFETSGFLYL